MAMLEPEPDGSWGELAAGNGKTDWWFGTFFTFPYIGNSHANGRTHIFQMGLKTPTSLCFAGVSNPMMGS